MPLRAVSCLDDGRTLEFDRLLIATGSHPVRPPIPGLDSPGVHSCWTLEDARDHGAGPARYPRVADGRRLHPAASSWKRSRQRGVELTVVEMGDRMVPRMMGAGRRRHDTRLVRGPGRARLHRHPGRSHQAVAPAGIIGRLASALGLAGQAGRRLGVRLSGGRLLEADLVISATGVAACDRLPAGSGIPLPARRADR